MSKRSLIITICCVGLLQGCIAAGVIGIVGGASAINDNRSFGNQIDDQKIELQAHNALSKVEGLKDNTNIQVVSVNGQVLVVGQASNNFLKNKVIKIINEVDGVELVHNQVRVIAPASFANKSKDTLLTLKVKTALLTHKNLDAANIKVVTEQSEVFLMGLVTINDANTAIEIARNVSGVTRVYKIFEIIK